LTLTFRGKPSLAGHGFPFFRRKIMPNETIVPSSQIDSTVGLSDQHHLAVGTQVLSFYGVTSRTTDGTEMFTGLYARGQITAIHPERAQCYAVDFPSGVSVFLSQAELADNSHYQVQSPVDFSAASVQKKERRHG
jgi:hypothetical protein